MKELNLKVFLNVISSDNLSAHDLIGLQTNFSSGFFCRFFIIHYNDFREKLHKIDLIIRKNDLYKINFDDKSYGILYD